MSSLPLKLKKAAEKFSPIVYLHPDDEYRPWAVEEYLKHVKLCLPRSGGFSEINPVGDAVKLLNIKDERTFEESSGDYASGYYLTIMKSAEMSVKDVQKGNVDKAPYYVHIRRAPDRDDQWDIQYIFFYPYNGKLGLQKKGIKDLANFIDNVVGSGLLGNHEADFEHITVRVNDAADTIEKIYFSAHYHEGAWYYRKEPGYTDGFMLESRQGENQATHPIVFSAKNSHASYPTPGQKKRSTLDVAENNEFLAAGGTILNTDNALPDDDVPDTKAACLVWDGSDNMVFLSEIGNDIKPPVWVDYSGMWGKPGAIAKIYGPAFQGWWYNDDRDYVPYGQAILFHNRNNCRSRVVFATSASGPQLIGKKYPRAFPNDVIRSVSFFNVPQDTIIELYDNPSGSTKDDWIEIKIRRDIDFYYLKSMERNINDGVIQSTYHAKDRLSGKISRIFIR